jgi:hypothetical protein
VRSGHRSGPHQGTAPICGMEDQRPIGASISVIFISNAIARAWSVLKSLNHDRALPVSLSKSFRIGCTPNGLYPSRGSLPRRPPTIERVPASNLVVPCSYCDAVQLRAARMKYKCGPKAGYAGSARTANAWEYDAARAGVQKRIGQRLRWTIALWNRIRLKTLLALRVIEHVELP